jgi:hypothetical protein
VGADGVGRWKVRERGILFSGPMVRAILDGRKTQTRRVMKPQPEPREGAPGKHWWSCNAVRSMVSVEDELNNSAHWDGMAKSLSPFDADRLWVKETFRVKPCGMDLADGRYHTEGLQAVYECDQSFGKPLDATPALMDKYRDGPDRLRPSIFMPRWASRLALEVVAVRAERLNSMTQEDAVDEGCEGHHGKNGGMFVNPLEAYAALWDSLNAKRGFSWESNPWVWVVEFRRLA